MLRSLKYVVTFNTTGRTLKNQLSFKPGITVIKGENESGKSFVLEMIRYALFGTEALRGKREDYDRLDVTLVVTIKGKDYTIVRKGNKATVNVNEAVGTSATNNYLRKVLGYGLDVFDIACNANQGELDKLTKDMKPTARQRMIDEVTGLVQFEVAEKDCREEANSFRKLADALEAQLVEPVEPGVPDNYEPSSKLKVRLDAEIRYETMREQFKEVQEPVEPAKPAGSRDSVSHEGRRRTYLAQKEQLTKKLAKLPENTNVYGESELRSYLASVEQDERGPLPDYPRDDLDRWHDAWTIRQRESEPLRCQECGAIVTGKELPPEPALSPAEIAVQLERHDSWRGVEPADLPESPLTRQEIEAALKALEAEPERKLLEQQIADLGDEPEDRSEEAEAWLNYADELRYYERDKQDYANYLVKKAEIDALPEPELLLRERYEMALRYETLRARYEASLEVYDQQKEKLTAARSKAEGYKRGSDALKDARKDVKRYLVPSLSKVASNLLIEMTDGERRHIFIDENFEIWVDKQPVRTLSGSGVSVVNLALRIALGQVLTQSVLPIFLADEIDANMAAKRTKATHDSLTRLGKKLSQIVVVTHKEYEGDHTICLT